jgi:hypothetical protein
MDNDQKDSLDEGRSSTFQLLGAFVAGMMTVIVLLSVTRHITMETSVSIFPTGSPVGLQLGPDGLKLTTTLAGNCPRYRGGKPPCRVTWNTTFGFSPSPDAQPVAQAEWGAEVQSSPAISFRQTLPSVVILPDFDPIRFERVQQIHRVTAIYRSYIQGPLPGCWLEVEGKDCWNTGGYVDKAARRPVPVLRHQSH